MRFRLPHKAVYWAPLGADANGRPTYTSPVELPCRWEDHISETLDSTGAIVLSSATVYLVIPVLVSGMLMQGVIDSGTPPVPRADVRAREILNVGNVSNLKGTSSLITANLK